MPQTSILITGASSGIGEAIAREAATQGHSLILVARSADKLKALAKELPTQATAIPLDLTDPQAPQELLNQTQDTPIHTLINNAGFADFGPFHKSDLPKQLSMIDLNIRSLTTLTHLFLPQMISNKEGQIINVASTAAFFPGPLMSVYYATKNYVLAFSEAVNAELEGTGVNVSTLCPGPVKTNFQEVAEMKSSKIMQGKFMTAQDVARETYDLIQNPIPITIPGTQNKILTNVPRFFPRKTITKIIYDAQKPQGS